MIEFLGFLGYAIVALAARHLSYEYAFIMNAVASICIVFILFTRVFLHICMDRVWIARRRQIFLCCMYGLLLIEAGLSVLYFTKEFEYSTLRFLQHPIQGFIYVFSLVMFVFVKQHEFSNRKLYGVPYTVHVILDTVLIANYLLLDFLITPDCIAEQPDLVLLFGVLLFAITIINTIILIYKPYWLHKRALKIRMQNMIKKHQEIDLIHPPKKVLQENEAIRELVYTLDYSPVRLFEAILLVKLIYKLMLKAGRSCEDATKLAAGYANVIVLNLMKRKYDFSFLPSFTVRALQKKITQHKVDLNRRGVLNTSIIL